MAEKMINNTYRPDKDEAIKLHYISLLDPRCENYSMAIRYAFAHAAEAGIDFAKAKAYKHKNTENYEPEPDEYGKAKSYCALEDDFNTVINLFKEKFNPDVVRVSYLTRLVTSNYLMYLTKNATPGEKTIKVKNKSIDGVELLQRVNDHAAELIKVGDLGAILTFIGDKED